MKILQRDDTEYGVDYVKLSDVQLALSDAQSSQCDWKEDDEGYWETSCRRCLGTGNFIHCVDAEFARQLERENAELLEALKLLTSHGHADDCLLISRSGESCDCGLDYAHVVIAKAKGTQL